jgi:dihydroorotate dehydrogenase electron transfer subunit
MTENVNKVSADAGSIRDNRKIAPGHFLLSIGLPESFPEPFPGQFVMLHNMGNYATILSRPFSVHGFRKERDKTILEILYRVSGRGTLLLSHMKTGTEVKVLGPLGNGFACAPGTKKILLAGGVGVAPLAFFLQRETQNGKNSASFDIYLGAKDAEVLEGLKSRIPAGAGEILLATDDGSVGYHGPVTDILKGELRNLAWDHTTIFACGPSAMLRSLARIIEDEPAHCVVSLEERMACGIGACLGCVVETKDKDGKTYYKRVCKEGPVFDIREIVWNP